MAAGRHLGFSQYCISDEIFQFLLCQGICSSNFSQKAQSMRKLLTFFLIQDGGPAAILGFSQFRISYEIFPIYVIQGICSSNSSHKAQSTRKLLTFW